MNETTSMPLLNISLLLLTLLLLLTASSHGAIYRYIDPKGRVILTDKPKHDGYIPLVKTHRGWVPKKRYRSSAANRRHYSPHIRKAAKRHGLSYHLLHAVITVESAYDPKAVSRAGAQGLMQLMPATAHRFGVRNPFNPIDNINGGSKYLSYLLKRYQGNYRLALAAYNAGENAVKRYGNRIPPYKETRNYVQKVLKHYKKYRSQLPAS